MIEFKRIHSDERGNLYTINLSNKEFLLMETKAGYSRGGDYHNSRQHDIVLSGIVEFKMVVREEKKKVLESGEKIEFEAGVPHMFLSLTDSFVLEWLDGLFEKSYYPPYRKLVEQGVK